MRIPLKCDSIKGKNNRGKVMRAFNYSEIRNQKWDSDILSLIAAIYKEAVLFFVKHAIQFIEKKTLM